MIKLIPNKPQLENNLERIDAPIRRIENRVKACIHDLNESFNNFWKLPDDQINEILAFHGVQEITKIFTAHFEYGIAFNKLLEERGVATPRAILEKPRELEMIDGVLKVVPLPEPEIPEIVDPVIE